MPNNKAEKYLPTLLKRFVGIYIGERDAVIVSSCNKNSYQVLENDDGGTLTPFAIDFSTKHPRVVSKNEENDNVFDDLPALYNTLTQNPKKNTTESSPTAKYQITQNGELAIANNLYTCEEVLAAYLKHLLGIANKKCSMCKGKMQHSDLIISTHHELEPRWVECLESASKIAKVNSAVVVSGIHASLITAEMLVNVDQEKNFFVYQNDMTFVRLKRGVLHEVFRCPLDVRCMKNLLRSHGLLLDDVDKVVEFENFELPQMFRDYFDSYKISVEILSFENLAERAAVYGNWLAENCSNYKPKCLHMRLGTTSITVEAEIQTKSGFIEHKKDIIPFCISYNGTRNIGKNAKEVLIYEPENVITNVSEFFGKKYDDIYNTGLIQESFCQITNHDSFPMFKVKKHKNVLFSPECVAAKIFKQTKEYVEKNWDQKFDHVVYSVPNSYDECQKKSVERTSRIAGIDRFIVLPERSRFSQRTDEYLTELLICYGARNLELTLNNIDGRIASKKYLNCAGDAINLNMFDHFVNKFMKRYPQSIFIKLKNKRILKKKCEEIKKELSNVELVNEIFYDFDIEKDCELYITREEFCEINKDIFNLISEHIQKFLEENCIKLNEVSRVTVVGGSSKIPKVKNIIKDIFKPELVNFEEKMKIKNILLDLKKSSENGHKLNEFDYITFNRLTYTKNCEIINVFHGNKINLEGKPQMLLSNYPERISGINEFPFNYIIDSKGRINCFYTNNTHNECKVEINFQNTENYKNDYEIDDDLSVMKNNELQIKIKIIKSISLLENKKVLNLSRRKRKVILESLNIFSKLLKSDFSTRLTEKQLHELEIIMKHVEVNRDLYIKILQNTNKNEEVLPEINCDSDMKNIDTSLSTDDKIALIYLLYDSDEALGMIKKIMNPNWNYSLSNSDDWKQYTEFQEKREYVVEALLILGCYSDLVDCKLDLINLVNYFMPEVIESSRWIHPIKKILYVMFEQLREAELKNIIEKFAHNTGKCPSYYKIEDEDYKHFEIIILKLIKCELIKLGSWPLPENSNSHLKCNVAEFAKCLGGELKEYSDQLTAIEKYINDVRKESNSGHPSLDGAKKLSTYTILNPRSMGYFLIFNHCEFKNNPYLKRRGTQFDVKALEDCWKMYGFEVSVYDDLSREVIKQEIKKMADKAGDEHSSFAVTFLTHGYSGVVNDCNEEPLQISEIKKIMCESKKLSKKPKLLIVQACRVKNTPSTLLNRNNIEQDCCFADSSTAGADLLVFYSTLDEDFSRRDTQKGTWFIQELCEVVTMNGEEKNLANIYAMVTNNLSKKHINGRGQVCPMESTLRKKFKLPKKSTN